MWFFFLIRRKMHTIRQDESQLLYLHCLTIFCAFDWARASIVGNVLSTKRTRKFIEAWNTTPTYINQCTKNLNGIPHRQEWATVQALTVAAVSVVTINKVVQLHFYRMWQVEPCQRLDDIARRSSWANEVLTICSNKTKQQQSQRLSQDIDGLTRCKSSPFSPGWRHSRGEVGLFNEYIGMNGRFHSLRPSLSTRPGLDRVFFQLLQNNRPLSDHHR